MICKYFRYVNGYRVWTDTQTLIATVDLEDRQGAWGEVIETGKVLYEAPFRYPSVFPFIDPSDLVNIIQLDREAFLDLLDLSLSLSEKNSYEASLYPMNLIGGFGVEGYYNAFLPDQVHKVLSEAERQGFDVDTIEVNRVRGISIASGSLEHSPILLRFLGMGFIGVIGVAPVKPKNAKIFVKKLDKCK